ncbi:MAG: hypothetical protein IJ611_08160 [Bacteroidales bacterium]|nr:hypothetical protein [Bacteroidales bacterium]
MIYIVSHPGKEPDYRPSQWRQLQRVSWNKTSIHRRKFIERSGTMVDGSGSVHPHELVRFWAEYEPASECLMLNTKIIQPKALHTRLIPVGPGNKNPRVVGNPGKCNNTDPYVFGGCFYYTCCKRYKHSMVYKRGDIILFGSLKQDNTKKYGILMLDTVLVVREEVPMNKIPSTSNFYKASIDPLRYFGAQRNTVVAGIMYGSPEAANEKMYSFVPCQRGQMYAGKPEIDLNVLGFNTYSRADIRIPPIACPNPTALWSSIRNHVLRAFDFGVYFDPV